MNDEGTVSVERWLFGDIMIRDSTNCSLAVSVAEARELARLLVALADEIEAGPE